MVAAATDAVCCHNTDTSTKMDAMKISARAIWLTGREGNGLTSTSEPVELSRSSCQPGNVASRTKVTKASIMATILREERFASAYVVFFLAVRGWSYFWRGRFETGWNEEQGGGWC